MNTNSILFQKPITELPRFLIFKNRTKIRPADDLDSPVIDGFRYTMADTKTGDLAGEMVGTPVLYNDSRRVFYPIETPYKSFYVAEIFSEIPKQGYGTAMINFAKTESVKYGCQGRIHLIASRIFSPRRPPHVFYRKLGFASNSPTMNNLLDVLIRNGKQLDWTKADNLDMYLEVEKTAKQRKLNSVIKFLKRIVK